jgi:hypothetical protein
VVLESDTLSIKLPFEEQIAFFKQKLNLPSAKWDDVLNAAHDRAFMVAGAMGADLLSDLRAAVDAAVEDGESLQQFRKRFWVAVESANWRGWTGDESPDRRRWRTRLIYTTNLNSSYAAGREVQLNDPELLELRPYWTYLHADGIENPRPPHVAWHGLTLHYTHEFWRAHSPPNGWGCHCRKKASSKKQYEEAVRQGRGPEAAPPAGDVRGIDEGFRYSPGRSLLESVRRKAEEIGGGIGRDLADALERVEAGSS